MAKPLPVPAAWGYARAVAFNGTSQYLTLASGLALGANDLCWISGWFWMDALGAIRVLCSLGVGGSANNKRDVIFNTSSGGQIQVRSVNNAGGATPVSTAYSTAGAWFHVLAEWGGTTFRAVTVNNGTRVTNVTSSSLSVAPDQFRVGTSQTVTSLLNGRAAHVGVFAGTPTDEQRSAAARGVHPLLIAPATAIEVWDTATVGPVVGLWHGYVLDPVAGGALALGPYVQQRAYQPTRRSGPVSSGVVTLPTDAGSYGITGSDAGLVYSGSTASVVTLSRSIFRGVFPRVPGRVN